MCIIDSSDGTELAEK